MKTTAAKLLIKPGAALWLSHPDRVGLTRVELTELARQNLDFLIRTRELPAATYDRVEEMLDPNRSRRQPYGSSMSPRALRRQGLSEFERKVRTRAGAAR